MCRQEFDQFSDRQVALGPAADLGDELVKRERSPVVFLKRLGEHDRVDRRQAQIGKEPGFLVDRASKKTRRSARRASR